MSSKVRKVIKRAFWLTLVSLLIASGVIAYINRVEIQNRISAANYQPDAAMLSLIESISLTEKGDLLIRSTHPNITDGESFRNNCSKVDHSEDGHILGCYLPDSHEIHLLNVTDERLKGIVEVTAAHEMLHAAWAQMPDNSRHRLSKRIKNYYDGIKDSNPVLAERMQVYEHLKQRDFVNELHSVLGTEVAQLPGWLEKHYAQWLKNRKQIVQFYENYRQIFVDLQNEADELQQQMKEMRADIEARSEAYKTAVADFNAAVVTFNTDVENGRYDNDRDTQRRIANDLTQQKTALEATGEAINSDIADYEEKRQRLLEISEISGELYRNLDSID